MTPGFFYLAVPLDAERPGYPLVVRGTEALASVGLRRASCGRRLALRLLTAPAPACRYYPLPGIMVYFLIVLMM